MRYRRSDPDQEFDEYLKNPCISNKGFLYDQRMEEYLSNTEMSMDEIARLPGLGAGTVAQYARRRTCRKCRSFLKKSVRHRRHGSGGDIQRLP